MDPCFPRQYLGQSPAPPMLNDIDFEAEACTPRMASLLNRIESFRTWPNHVNATPKEIAEAGFFYLPNTKDDTKCFYCNGGLRHWDANDSPALEHAKWYPHCKYIQIKQENNISTGWGMDIPPPQQCRIQSNISNTTQMPQQVLVVPDDIKVPSTPQSIATILASGTVQNVKKFGFTEDLINAVVQIRIRNSQSCNSVEELVDSCIDAEDIGIKEFERRYEQPRLPAPACEMFYEPVTPSLNAARFHSQVLPDATIIKPSQTEDFLINQKLFSLKEEKICKVCLTNERNCFFFPCGHLCTCSDCADGIKTCPICRETIKKIQRVYY